MINEGIPSQIPPDNPLDESVNHAPVRKDILSREEKKLALANALRYFPASQHAELAPGFARELKQYGRIYMYRYRPQKPITAILKDRSPVRRITSPGSDLTKAHILTNGNYSVMVTGKGTGYSRTKTAAITRWRADNTLDRYGTFFYIRNCTNGKIWSAAYSPLNQIPDDYEVTFSNDKAVFSRLDGTIRTKTEIIVTLEDNVEIRRLSLKNSGDSPAVIEVTSYFEVVIAPAQADIAHPAFSNLFVETSYSARNHCIFACRRPRTDTEKPVWLADTS